MVPQEPLLFPNMSVEENVTIGFKTAKAELHRAIAAYQHRVRRFGGV